MLRKWLDRQSVGQIPDDDGLTFSDFRKLFGPAGRGHPGACRRLGMAYVRGEHVPRHLMSARIWLARAVELGDVSACAMLARVMVHEAQHGRQPGLVPNDTLPPQATMEDAVAVARTGADAGDHESIVLMARLSFEVADDDLTHRQALLLRAASDDVGDAWAQSVVARAAEAGEPWALVAGLGSRDSARIWIEKALGRHTVDPVPFLAGAFMAMAGVIHGGLPRAKRLMAQAADYGSAVGCLNHGCQLLRDGDELHGVSYLMRASRLGHADAAAVLGDWHNRPAERDIGQAVKWYVRAFELGHAGARRMLEQMARANGLPAAEAHLVQAALASRTKTA